MTESGAYEMGRRAFKAGLKLSDCPLAARSKAWHDWMRGYREAEIFDPAGTVA